MIKISSKKIKKDGIYFIGNNSIDVTGSMTLIKFSDKQILLECGMTQSNSYLESYWMNAEKFPFNPKLIDYLFIPHLHIDHSGLVPKLVKSGFQGKIICTHQTATIMKPMLMNCCYILDSEARILKKKYGGKYHAVYDESDVLETMDYIYEYDDSNIMYQLDDKISFRWQDNSHCLGAKQLELFLDDGIKKKSVLYTSDLGALRSENDYVDDTVITDNFHDIVIMESTYGERSRIQKKTRQKDIEIFKTAINTVLDRGGRIVMPAFSFARTQQLMTTLYDMFADDRDWKYEICVDSKLTCEITDLYLSVLKGEDFEKFQKVYNWENIRLIADKDISKINVNNKNPKIIISSSGFCTQGRVLNYLSSILPDEKNMVIFSGYTGNDPSYLSYRIKNSISKNIKINKIPVENKADCLSLTTFSSHANRNDLIEFGSSQNTNRIYLVHGSEVAKKNLQTDLQEALFKKNKSTRVIIPTKGTICHL